MNTVVKYLIVFTISFGALLWLLEFVSGQVLELKTNQESSQAEEYPSFDIALYSDYQWAAEFFKGKSENPHPNHSYFPYTMWTTKNWASKLVNFDSNGVRLTFNQAKNDKKVYRIYMFGGSTLANGGVPDEYTISSNISKILSESHLSSKYRFEVNNFGSGAYSSTQELIRLIFEAQRGFEAYGKPDLVIFYDGVTDVFSGIYLERPGIHDAYDRIKMRYDDINKFYLLKLKELITKRSNTYRLINYFFGRNEEDDRYFENKDLNYQKYAIDSVKIYKQNTDIVKSLGSQYGFESIFFLQPNIYISSGLTSYDNNVRNKWITERPRMAEAYDIGYTQFKKLTDDEIMIDITNIFDGSQKPIYRDYAHVGPYGDYLVAESMASHILTKIESIQ